MKKIFYSIIVASAFLSSCSNVDFGDTNENINGTQNPDMAAMLAGAILDFGGNTGSYIAEPTLYAQYQSQVVYTTESRYSESPKEWGEYYGKELNNLNTIMAFLADPANHTPYVLAQGKVENQIGVAKIFRAIVMKRVTDTWGDAPFSQAAQGLNNPTPKFDAQEEIYKALIADLKEGRDMLVGATDTLKGDVLLDGNLDKWRRLANSMLMTCALQLSNKYPDPTGFAAETFNEALNSPYGSIESSDQEAWFKYDSKNGFRNPFSFFRSEDYRVSQELTDALKGRTGYNRTSNRKRDDRILVLTNLQANKYNTMNGLPYGYSQQSLDELLINSSTNIRLQMSGRFTTVDAPLPLFVSAYSLLNRAEAAALGWTSEDATALLDQAIDASYSSLNSKFGTTIDPNTFGFKNARLLNAATSPEMLLQIIREEKWIALFPSGFEAWSEFRRTGVPALLPAPDYLNNGTIPGRYNYPQTEKTLNATNYNIGVSTLSPASDNNSSKVWWAQ